MHAPDVRGCFGTDDVDLRERTETARVADAGAPSQYLVTSAQAPGKGCVLTFLQTSCTITGLTNGTAHTFTVKSRLASWLSAASAPSAAVTPGTRPAKPTVKWSSSKRTRTVKAQVTKVTGVAVKSWPVWSVTTSV